MGIRTKMRGLSLVRAVLCRKSIAFRTALFIAACMSFYASYKLLAGVIKSKSYVFPSPHACVQRDGAGVVIPCDDDADDSWVDRDTRWPEDDPKNLGDFNPAERGAHLLLEPYRPQKKTHHPSHRSGNPNRYLVDPQTVTNKTTAEKDVELEGDPGNHSEEQLLLQDFEEKIGSVSGKMKTDSRLEKRKTDSEVKKRARKTDQKLGIPLVVVEEHHDVIPYWYKAVDQGLVSSRGNVLLHVDAHADLALPLVNASFPLFRPPHPSELVYLMQRNDMFITGAALTGFFDRYIWVVPAWDTRIRDVLGSKGYSRYSVFAGFLRGPEHSSRTGQKDADELREQPHKKTAQSDPEVCYCVDFQPRENQDMERSSQCFVNTRRNGSHPLGVAKKVIFREQCQARVHAMAEIILEDKAIELLNAGIETTTAESKVLHNQRPPGKPQPLSLDHKANVWLSERESIILDIDEDYYGVEAAITPLEDASVDIRILDTISEMVTRIFCAQNAQQEATADSIFSDLLDVLYDDLILCQHNNNCVIQSHSDLETFSSKLNGELRTSSVAELVCAASLHVMPSLVSFLIKDLFFLTGEQLRALGQVGICLKESPRTMEFDASRGMKVCLGHNRPGNSAVTFHVPDEQEMGERSRQLRRLLHSWQFSPRLITLARSVRDGYTPRGSSRRIEEDLLDILHGVYPQVSHHAIVFDSQLLGGRRGWADRLH